MSQDVVIITDSDLPGRIAEDVLEKAGKTVVRAKSSSEDDIAEAARDADALIVQWAPITDSLLERLPRLRFVSRLGIGYDMIDVDAASARGISVANTPTYCVEEVTMHTMAMILGHARGLYSYDRHLRDGSWSAITSRPHAGRPSEMTVSVIGYGRIGSLVATHAASLGFRVLVFDPFIDPAVIQGNGGESTDLSRAIADADILTLHAPLTTETHHMIDAAALASMRPGAVIVNTCRGALIDEDALASAIESGHLGGAALDVFEVEPLATDSRLRQLDGVLLTPHAAWYSPHSMLTLPEHAARNVVDFLDGRRVGSIVNATALAKS